MSKITQRLDPRNPWVFDTRDLPRGAGQQLERRRSVPAPSDLRTDMIGVADGSEIDIEIRMASVSEGVWVSGRALAQAAGECSRCLEPVEATVAVRFSGLYAYDPASLSDPDDLDAEDLGLLIDDHLDLEPVVRDAVMLGFPLRPLCRAECSGLCSICGIRLDDLGDAAAEHSHETIDPRWAALRDLAATADQGGGPETAAETETEES